MTGTSKMHMKRMNQPQRFHELIKWDQTRTQQMHSTKPTNQITQTRNKQSENNQNPKFNATTQSI
jgi:hypothetical protein